MISNNGLTKSYKAGAAIAPYTIVKWDTSNFQVVTAGAATDKLLGITPENTTVPAGQRVDVIVGGIAECVAGGTIARGDPITSDAQGRAITAAPGAGVNNRIVGFAEQSAVLNDVFPVMIYPGFMQG